MDTLKAGRGIFIVFEGIDKCGKTTQSKELVRQLRKNLIPRKLFHFPNRETKIGKVIDEHLKGNYDFSDEAAHMLFSSNRWECKHEIIQTLDSKNDVICDRYSHSGIAFSAAKGVDIDWCKSTEKGLPKPDLVIYLNISTEEASKRGGYGEEIYENIKFQKKVKEIYEEKLKDESWVILDGTKSNEQLKKEIMAIVLFAKEKYSLTPIQTM